MLVDPCVCTVYLQYIYVNTVQIYHHFLMTQSSVQVRYPTLAICNFPEGIGASTRDYLETKLLDRCPIDLSLDNWLDPVGTLIGAQFSGSFPR